jgi:hypothetical protein
MKLEADELKKVERLSLDSLNKVIQGAEQPESEIFDETDYDLQQLLDEESGQYSNSENASSTEMSIDQSENLKSPDEDVAVEVGVLESQVADLSLAGSTGVDQELQSENETAISGVDASNVGEDDNDEVIKELSDSADEELSVKDALAPNIEQSTHAKSDDADDVLLSENKDFISPIDSSFFEEDDEVLEKLQNNQAFLNTLGYPTEMQDEEELAEELDEKEAEQIQPEKVNSSTEEMVAPPLFVMRDTEADPEQIIESASGINTDSPPPLNESKLNIEKDSVKIPSDLLSKLYKLNVIFTFNKPTLSGNMLKSFEINSPEGCIDLRMRNGSVIKDYGKGFSVSGDSERELGLAAIKMAKMKGWKCIKASGDPSYLAELETLCKENGLGLRRTDIDYSRILNRVNNSMVKVDSSAKKSIAPEASDAPGKHFSPANGSNKPVEENEESADELAPYSPSQF